MPTQRSLFDDDEPIDGRCADDPAAAPAADPLPAPEPMKPIAARDATRLQPADSLLRHAESNRDIRLGEHAVGYLLLRARRRSIGFVVGTDGLRVSAPKWIGQGEIDKALRAKGDWILRKLQEQHERRSRQLAATVDWRDGTSIPFLGQPVVIVLDPRVTGAVLDTADAAQGVIDGVARMCLHVGLPHDAMPAQVRDAVQSWLQRQARRVFEERCQLFAQRLGVRYTRLALSSAQTRWGSASSKGSIRLNWRLIHFGLATIDYVVAHELAHLREMNHSPRFWDVVRSVMPDYEAARGVLKTDTLPVFD